MRFSVDCLRRAPRGSLAHIWLVLKGRSTKMRCLSLTVCLTLVASLLVVPARAAPGDLDPSFGTGGKVTTDFGPGSNSASSAFLTVIPTPSREWIPGIYTTYAPG